jgi:hypothetical protein
MKEFDSWYEKQKQTDSVLRAVPWVREYMQKAFVAGRKSKKIAKKKEAK